MTNRDLLFVSSKHATPLKIHGGLRIEGKSTWNKSSSGFFITKWQQQFAKFYEHFYLENKNDHLITEWTSATRQELSNIERTRSDRQQAQKRKAGKFSTISLGSNRANTSRGWWKWNSLDFPRRVRIKEHKKGKECYIVCKSLCSERKIWNGSLERASTSLSTRRPGRRDTCHFTDLFQTFTVYEAH